MERLSLSLFGPGVLTLGGRAVRLHSARTLALLAYLAVEGERPHSRARLAEILWGCGDCTARQGLRQALYSLKTAAGGRLSACIRGDQDLIRLLPGSAVDIDVHRFLSGVQGTTSEEWSAAACLYRAPFLEGRAFSGCEALETWLQRTRERLQMQAIQNAERLLREHMAQDDLSAALKYAEHWRELDPASEAASRQLMGVLAARNEARRDGAPHPGESEALVKAARAAERVYAFSNAVELYDRAIQALKQAAPADPMRYAEVLLHKESVLERLGRRAEQATTIGEAIDVVERLGAAASLAAVLLRQAGVCAYLGKHGQALQASARALEVYRDIGDGPGEAEALREMGFAHWRAQSYPKALQCAREALALHRRLGDAAGEASALHNLAEIYRGLGSPQQALEWYEQALQLHWATRNPQGEILTLFGIANALHQTGDWTLSRQKYEEALKLSERHGERTMQSRALHALAMQCADQKDLDSGLRLMQRAVEVDRAIGFAHALGHDLLDLSYLHLRRDERMEARAALQEALVWFGYTGDREALALARSTLEHLDSPGAVPALNVPRQWVKSHLPLGEGKVYCEFDSPLGTLRGKTASPPLRGRLPRD
jgi:DNA-binding SARP family transcriptional activator/Tfp pilus assembly protein PilF